ncbi:hypothetical protein JTE90_005404 [Oedothorax gibbosus]|uniref:C2 NT-type domain-containing protein n=1 Tax=Oedothorax gibbosus TaxID=931172 RepID=A0AAV6U382_9ARAC|nr:hypothetical protein JTE90_005404 [Oedothorax gibbosus]
MSFMLKKKKYKFKVDLVLQEISAVSFANGILFAKIRLQDGGTFTEMSQKQEVKNNCVKWDRKFQFGCKMTANASTGVLEPCLCRISIRKEVRGGRSFEKLGYASLNLAEFAGAGLTTRRYLLEGYDSKHRQDNSMLHISIEMFLLAGDPCFKTPDVRAPLGDKPEIQLPADKKGEDYSGDSLASGSSGFGSLPRKQRPNLLCSDLVVGTPEERTKEEENAADFERGHSRNSSYASQHSKASGYGSLASHSRQSSAESGHHRNPSSSSTYGEMCLSGVPKPTDRKRPSKKQAAEEGRMDSTRVSAKEVINEVFEATNLETDESTESPGLVLIIKNDGTPALSSHAVPDCSAGHYDQLILSHR